MLWRIPYICSSKLKVMIYNALCIYTNKAILVIMYISHTVTLWCMCYCTECSLLEQYYKRTCILTVYLFHYIPHLTFLVASSIINHICTQDKPIHIYVLENDTKSKLYHYSLGITLTDSQCLPFTH